MPNILNEKQLLKIMEEKATKALNNITEEVLELFKTEYIDKYVYNSHGPNKVYHDGSSQPTGEFREAWQWADLKKATNSLVTYMWYNPGKLSFDVDSFKHGSIYGTPEDARASLMDILNKQGYSSSLFLSVSRSVAYFDQFIIDLFDNGKLDQIIAKHFKKEGFSKI